MLHQLHGGGKGETGPATRGVTIPWARFYDMATAVLLLGQEPRLRAMTIDLAIVQPGKRVLEVGCGTGSLSLAAARRVGLSGKVRGIDPDPTMIAIARGKAAKVDRDLVFEIGLIEDLPFDTGEFDVVLSSLMLHHLPADLQVRGLAEVHRVLRPGGRFLAVDIDPETVSLERRVLRPLLGERMAQGGLRQLEPVLAAAGFTDIEWGRTTIRPLSYLRGWA